MMSQSASEDEDDTEVVMLESGKHTFSMKSRVEPSLSKSGLEVQLDDERRENVSVRRTIVDMRLARAESEQLRLKFVVDMEDIRKQQLALKKSQLEGVALLEMLAEQMRGP